MPLLLSTVSACTVKLSVASDSTTKGNVQSQNAFDNVCVCVCVCVCVSVRGDGLPPGRGTPRQENTWLRQATISYYGAVTGHVYLCGMFFYHMMKAYLSSVHPWYVSSWRKKKILCILERAEQSRLSLHSLEQHRPISGGAISSFHTLSFGL